MHKNIHELYFNEKLHKHIDFSEYYMLLFGSMKVLINDVIHTFWEWDVFRVDAWDIHKILELDKELGCKYLVVKERTYEGGTIPIFSK